MDLDRDLCFRVVLPRNEKDAYDARRALGLLSGPLSSSLQVQQSGQRASGGGDSDGGVQPHHEEQAGPLKCIGDESGVEDANKYSRDFLFSGEQATFYVLVGPSAKEGNRVNDLDPNDFVEISRSLEVLLSAADDSHCKVSSVLLCPTQPDSSSNCGKDDSQDGSIIDKMFGNACAVYYFEVQLPTTVSRATARRKSSNALNKIEFNLYFRLKSMSSKSLVAKVATGMAFSYKRVTDPMSLRSTMPEVQKILNNDELSTCLNSQTSQLCIAYSKVKCVAITSRSKQVNGKCFIEVCCENIHETIKIVLKDLTLHTFTSRPINMSVTRVGRWILPLELYPGDRQTVCFLLTDFQDGAPRHLEKPVDTKEDYVNPGAKYTSIATITWSSEVTLPDVRGQHRVEWQFASGAFDELVLRLIKVEPTKRRKISVGSKFTMGLLVLNRTSRDMDINVIMPAAGENDQQLVLPLDACVHVGKLEPNHRTIEVPLQFMALDTAALTNISPLIIVYDAISKRVFPVKEPYMISVFP
eukprot:CAMPEP_0203803414 /NCGR_PEP_ID=MMETSP0100_2-20121128/12815_1 /ASSEMBLY_ACC=CAM_ASM_000210 /TAXON_ID=96639 /ORGANISM=" , Strain NY0313808BC1" /LENGTH=526 /DNA_ID=CAMNT_0050711117 /DNA_START=132 /DNA_END=1713 /DNA_ORIENTATION=-